MPVLLSLPSSSRKSWSTPREDVPSLPTTTLLSIGGLVKELPDVIRHAAARRDLPVPPTQEAAPADEMCSVFPLAQPSRRDAVWPRFPPIRKYQEGAAADPKALKAVVLKRFGAKDPLQGKTFSKDPLIILTLIKTYVYCHLYSSMA
ncbi:uncharacterized protein LOC117477766 [Scomber scombrus]|uniref:Uncharacterized protein LOC117477766 n=1 Tax=Scomber scombrus TaxID=13677 RepID=A0AAV1PN84_SCOSC